MAREYVFYVYILASRSRTLYIGMTNGIVRRQRQHAMKQPGSFTSRYNVYRLVYYERHQYVLNAIAREKELKTWSRQRKVELIEQDNPAWEDLSEAFYKNYKGERIT